MLNDADKFMLSVIVVDTNVESSSRRLSSGATLYDRLMAVVVSNVRESMGLDTVVNAEALTTYFL